MYRFLKLSFLVMIIFIFGCSAEGEIKVTNKTGEWLQVKIDGDTYDLDDYEYAEKTIDLSDYGLYSDEKEVTVEGEGLVKWEFSKDYTIKADKTKKVNIYADCGAIKVWNSSYRTIVSVYLSPSSNYNWGYDDLDGYIYSGYIHSWRCASGYWDVKVIDDYGYYSTSYDNYISVGEVYWFTYYGSNNPEMMNQPENPTKQKANPQSDKFGDDRTEKLQFPEHREPDIDN
ncbi:MAG: hypothetical protein GF353_18970 [Candidatus Lokiarchaeota archaeon]|nr:hypothetical protein [Candidatus Lokiarchaeota archaeon]